MHDLDRSLFEVGEVGGGYGANEAYAGEQEEFLEVLGEFAGETQEASGYEVDPATRELELASELLEVSSEQELDRFLGDLVGTIASGAKTFANSATGRALGGILKQAAGQALPVIGKGIGGYFGGSTGSTWGERAGKGVGSLLGLELEGLSAEDRELEIARAFIRFVMDAVRQAMSAPRQAPPTAVAKAAATTAAQRHLPGLVPGAVGTATPATTGRPQAATPSPNDGSQTGRWVRSGRNIVILGL